MAADEGSEVAPPTVSPDVYDTEYYLNNCAGYQSWSDTNGAKPDPLYWGSLLTAKLKEGEVVVDIGTGRGELLTVAIGMGAAHAYGIEYSPSAVALARQTIDVAGVGESAEVFQADSRRIPLPDAIADLVTMLDVVEHLTPDELDGSLAEAIRILKPGGRILIHTMPTSTVYNVTYRLQRNLVPGRRRRWPKDPRNDLERTMHVNEQSRGGLTKSLRKAGFARLDVHHGQMAYGGFVPDPKAAITYKRLAKHKLTKPLGAYDLWGAGFRP